MWFSVSCFGVRFLVMFHLMFVDHTLVPFVLIVFCLLVILVISHFGFETGICLMIVPVPVDCFLVTYLSNWK